MLNLNVGLLGRSCLMAASKARVLRSDKDVGAQLSRFDEMLEKKVSRLPY